MTRHLSIILAASVLAAMLTSCSTTSRPRVPTERSSLVVGAPIAPTRARTLTPEAINQQDRPSRRERREQRRRDQRMGGRLLGALPLRAAGVRIINGGMSRDGRRTVLLLDGPSRRAALAVLHAELRRHHDRPARYLARFAPLLTRLPLLAGRTALRDGGDTPDGRARVVLTGPSATRALADYRRLLQRLHDTKRPYVPIYYAAP